MKAKSKVLLGLIVALAMMVFAVPAFAATTVTPDSDTASQEVYAGSDATFKFTINNTKTSTYSLTFTDAITGGTPFASTDISYTPETLAGDKVDVTVKVKTAGKVGTHKLTYRATDADTTYGESTATIVVKEAPKVQLSGYDEIPEAQKTTIDQLVKTGLKVGDPIGLNVVQPEKPATYNWQISKSTTKPTADQIADVNDKTNWEDLGSTDLNLNTAAKIENNGKYVRCLVTVDGATVVADAGLEGYTALTDQKTVKLTVSDATKVTVTTQDKTVTDKPADVKANYEFFAGKTNALVVEATAAGGTLTPTTGKYTYEWQKDGKPVTADTNTTFNTEKNTITFARVTDKTAGTYQCVVKDNAEPAVEGKSESFVIAVNPTPTMVIENSSVSKKAEYKNSSGVPDLENPTKGTGTVSYTADDVEKGMTLTVKVDGAEAKGYSWFKGGTAITGASGETYTLSAAEMAAIKAAPTTKYSVKAAFADMEKDLEFEVSFKEVSGSLSGGIMESVDGGVTCNPNPVYTVTLPAGYTFPDKIVKDAEASPADWHDNTKTTTGGQLYVEPLASKTEANTKGAKIKIIEVTNTTTATGVSTMKFQHSALTSALEAPFAADMDVTIVGAVPVNTTVGTGNKNINLPVSKDNGYKFTLPAQGYAADTLATAKQIVLKDGTNSVMTESYSGKGVEAEVIAKTGVEGVGEAKNIRYIKKDNITVPVPSADLATATTTAPVDAGTYWVICDIEAGDQWGANTNQLAGKIVISPLDLDDTNTTQAQREAVFKIDPKTVEYNGKVQEPNVTFADGVTKAGEVDKKTYKKAGTQTAVTPKEVGKYDVYVTTKDAPTGANIGAQATAVNVGTFEITKTKADAKNYTIDPAEVTYDGTPREAIVKVADGAGAVTGKHYFKDGSEEELEGTPTEAGVYTVKVDTAESDTYAATEEGKPLAIGTFTIKEDKPEPAVKPDIYMIGHVENIGWGDDTTGDGKGDGEAKLLKAGENVQVGTTGRSLRVEAVTILVPSDYTVEGFAHVEDFKDVVVSKEENPGRYITNMKDIPEGYVAYTFGTEGKAKRVEAVNIGIKDAEGKYVEGFEYATHVENMGWLGTVRNGSFSGSRGLALRMESIRFYYDDVVRKPTDIDAEAK